jgi:hypothetical protein
MPRLIAAMIAVFIPVAGFARIKAHPDVQALQMRGLSQSLQDMFKDHGGNAWPTVERLLGEGGQKAKHT